MKQTDEKNIQEYIDVIQRQDILYCVSSLVYELAKNERYMDDLFPCLAGYDYEETCYQEGWTVKPGDDGYYIACHKGEDDVELMADTETAAYEELALEKGFDLIQREALEHWIVDDHLADDLEEVGGLIVRDFLGLTIWGRETSGQSISQDGIIRDVAILRIKRYNEIIGKE